jgi:beta-xylosidase
MKNFQNWFERMNRPVGALAFFCWLLLIGTSHAWQSDLGDGRYQNPVLFADYSDPDVIRVGAQFYMVSSSFHLLPGIPVLASEDLVNWKIIGHVYDRFNFDPAYDLTRTNRYAQGCWAPAIRFHAGRFWVYFPTPQEGIFMSTAKSAAGPWTPPVPVKQIAGWEDPCPFWDDDGKAYLVHSVLGAGPLILHRMSADGTRLLDDGITIVSNRQSLPTLEGPKLYKRRGYYYIFAPAGGVKGGWQVVLRSKNIYGPYEHRTVLDQGDTAINGPHQGAYVETASGQPWFIHFQERGAYGRIFWLEPVKWIDDWPVIGQAADGATKGQPVLTWTKPEVGHQTTVQIPQTSDDFNSSQLGLQWQWNHNPDDSKWSLTKRPGFLRLEATPADSLIQARNTLTQMLADPAVTITTLLDTRHMADGQRAGLCLFGKPSGWIGVLQTQGRQQLASFTSNQEKPGPTIHTSSIQLRAYVTNGLASFSYSLDRQRFISVGNAVPLQFSWWKGARPGLFSYTSVSPTNQPPGTADFDWFHFEPQSPAPPANH